MPILQMDLQNAAMRSNLHKHAGPRPNQATAFLCHSHKDRRLAEGLQQWLHEQGMDLHVDWQDACMPEWPHAEAATRLRQRIASCQWFFFLATADAMASCWCPLELGYAEGKKPPNRIAIVPTRIGASTYGTEYLGLYQRLDAVYAQELQLFSTHGSAGVAVAML